MKSSDLRYEDPRINIKLLLSACWTSVMFLYIYGDYFELYVPGKTASLLSGKNLLNGPFKLLLATILMAAPSLMICLSLLLKARWNRALNITLGLFLSLFTLLVGLASFTEWRIYYVILSFTESIVTSIIVWKAWKWPTY